jgi:hypothetical protein
MPVEVYDVIARTRTVVFVLLAGAFFFWLRYGEEVLKGERRDAAQRAIAAFQDEHQRQYPETANWLEQQKAEFGDRALAASLRAQRGLLSSFESQQHSIRNSARLISIFQNDATRDDSILWSHGTALTTVSGDEPELRQLSDLWLQRLETAKADPAVWPLVRDNPLALTSDLILADREQRDFYANNQAWIDDLVTALMQTVDDESSVQSYAATQSTEPQRSGFDPLASPELPPLPPPTIVRFDSVLDIAFAFHPQLKNAITDPLGDPVTAAVIFLTFAENRDLMSELCAQNVPATEAVEVLLLNGDAILGSDSSRKPVANDPVAQAARLVRVYRDKKRVWDQARREPLVLRFDEAAPKFSQGLIERFPDHGVASLVITQFPDEPDAAAAAIDRYGELAMAVLVHYAPSERFHTLLGDPSLGFRTVMVAVMEGDVGLEKLAGDRRYLDKLVDEDGTPRKADWWQAVPVVGGIANVARNYATDRPSDWSEIGWAAWDVVDAALIVGSLGTAKLATEVGKQGLKSTARLAGREAAASAATRTAAVAQVRTTSLLEGIAKTSARSSSAATSLAVSATSGEMAAAAAKVGILSTSLRIGSRVVTLAFRPMMAVSGKAYQTTRVVFAAAASMPPAIRLWVTRGLLGISLMARTPQMATKIAASIADFSTAVVDQLSQRVDEIKSMIGLPLADENALSHGIQRLTYFGILGGIGAMAMWVLLRPSHRRRNWLGRLGF